MDFEYIDRVTEHGDHVECERCRSIAPTALFERIHDPESGGANSLVSQHLCELCASTLAGNVLHYQRLYDPNLRKTVEAMLQVGNIIRNDIRELAKRLSALEKTCDED